MSYIDAKDSKTTIFTHKNQNTRENRKQDTTYLGLFTVCNQSITRPYNVENRHTVRGIKNYFLTETLDPIETQLYLGRFWPAVPV